MGLPAYQQFLSLELSPLLSTSCTTARGCGQVERQMFVNDLQPFMKSRGLQGWHFTKQEGQEAEGLAMFYNGDTFKCLRAQQVCLTESVKGIPGTLTALPGDDGQGQRLALARAFTVCLFACITQLPHLVQMPTCLSFGKLLLCKCVRHMLTCYSGVPACCLSSWRGMGQVREAESWGYTCPASAYPHRGAPRRCLHTSILVGPVTPFLQHKPFL